MEGGYQSMSKQIDERVVSMQFDNKNFEKNVSQTMSTLDKFKQKLHLTGASKGLEEVNTAARKVDMKGLASGVETVSAKFSALQVMGVTALANITNSAVNAGKNIVKSLTIAPVKTGFNEYELKMGSIQTIMAGTGESLETVNKYLNELNEYSDKTIYSFQDMTSNIGKFTNAGVQLEDAVLAIKGISNEAAVSGANANEASRAMYNFAQALSAGYVKLIDWKSIELANMATVDFKNQLISTAVAAGTLTDNLDGTYTTLEGKVISATQNFNDSLQDQWMTSDVLINTLKNYADETTDIGKKASKAATEVKTFSMMMDTLKESAQSGWAQTWEILVGDYDEAKHIFTKMSDFFGGLISKMSNFRNKVLERALGKPLKKLTDRLDAVTSVTKKMSDAMTDYGKIVDRVIGGEFGNGQTRWNKLTESGYDWAHVQNLVNERLGDTTRHATNYTEAQGELNKTQAITIEQLVAMNDEQLKNLEFTDDEIKALRELEDQAKKTNKPISELIEELSTKPSGRDLLIETGKNLLEAITKPLNAIKEAWNNTFKGDYAQILYNVIEKLHDFSDALIMSDDSAKNFKTIMEGVFAGFQIANWAIGGGLMAVLKIAAAILDLFGTNLLEVGANIASYITKFRDWVDEHTIFVNSYGKIAEVIKAIIDGISRCVKAFLDLGIVGKILDKFKNAISGLFGDLNFDFNSFSVEGIVENITKVFDKLESWIKGMGEAENIGKYIIDGLIKGLKNGITKIGKFVWNIGTTIIESICNVLGIHSPSRVMIAIGGFIISGLIAGIAGGEGDLKERLSGVFKTCYNVIKGIVKKIVEFLKDVDLGTVISAGVVTGLFIVTKKISDALMMFGEAAEGFGKLCSGAGKLLSDIGDRINPKKSKFSEIARGVLELAIAIGILAASVYVLAKLKPNELWPAIGALAALAGIIVLLSAAAALVNSKGGSFGKLSVSLIGITAALWIMASAIKKLSFLNEDNWKYVLGGLAGMIAGLGLIFVAFGLFVKGEGAKNISKAGAMLIKMSLALLLMIGVMKLMSTLDIDTIHKGGGVILAFSALFVGLVAMTRLAGNKIDKVGATILKLSAAMLLLTFTMKIISSMHPSELDRGLQCILVFSAIIVGLIAATRLMGKDVKGIGAAIFGVSAAMLMMALTARITAGMDPADFAKGIICIAAFGGIIVGLIAATKLAGGPEKTKGLALSILAMSFAIGILAAVAMVLSLLKVSALAKGIIAVGLLAGIMSMMVIAAKNAKGCQKDIIAITIAIGVITAAVVALSFIDPTKLAGSVIALGVLMGMFALMTLAAKKVNSSIGTLIVMSIAIGLMAGAIYLLAQLPVESVIGSATGLSLMVLSLSAAMILLSTVGKFAKDALLGVLALTAMAVPLLAFVGILALMQNIQNVMPSVMALIALTTAMTLLLIPLTIVGAFGMAGLPYLGVLALLTMAVPLLAFVGILALMQNIQNAEKNAMLLVTLMTTMTACLVTVSLVAPLALLAVGAITALVGVITGFGILVTAIGALVTKFPQLETFLDTGIPILEKLANGIGSILGNFISGFAVSAMSGLPEMGLLLSQFMMNAMPFIAGAKMIDASTMDGVKALAEVILILTAADILQGLTSWLTGGSSIADFGNEIAAFGPSIRAFADSVAGIDCESVKAAAEAAKALAEMTATIPNEGGVAGWFAGENSIVKFAAELPVLGSCLKMFSDSVAGVNAESITAASEAAKALAEMTATIPNEGGVAAWFAGENSISKFAMNLPLLGLGLKLFSDSVAGINAENVNAAVSAGKAICEMTDNIPNEGGMVSWFTGDNSIAKFSTQLGDLGTAISDFATNVGDANIDNVNKAVKATKALSELLATDVSKNSKTMEKFGERLSEFGNKFSEFCKKMSKIKDSSITSAIDKFNKLKDMASTLSADSISSLTKFSNTLIEVAENGIKEFVNALNSETIKADANEAISDLVSDIADKIETKSNKNKFKSAGKYLIEGLAEGIKANKSKATKAAQEVADAVEQIIRSAWEVNSPSKVFYRIALGIGEGMEYALSDSTLGVKNSARDLADTTTKGFGNAISQINDMFNGTFDTQPTIRPVLDLSDVQAGASSIAGLFSGNRTLSVSAPGIGAISASMANRQNGNNDLASAINKLAKSNAKSGDTYQINGISYSEGSDVADAIQTLVRAAKMEGRT